MKVKTIVPLGEECYTCESIDQKFNINGIRNQAYPFDYVGHSYIEAITDKIKNGLELKQEDLIISQDFYQDKVYGFKYWHDKIEKGFLDKYNRRY